MKKLKKNKGVTLIIVTITVIIMGILLATTVYNAQKRNKMSMLDNLYTDLTMLEGKYKAYYQQYNYIPVEELYTGDSSFKTQMNPNDNDKYYVVDTQKISNVSLKIQGTFIINDKTLSVYYPNGVTVDGKTYYTLPSNSSSQTISMQTKSMKIKGISDGSWNEEKQINCPQLLDGMIPVYWTSTGTEIEITGNSMNEWENWYDYSQKKWANAVTKDENGNVTGYWVWIPRYEYKITNPGTENESEILIQFIQTSQTTPDEGYTYIHPAFMNGSKNGFKNGEWDEEIPGFWVAKYMAGFQASTIDSNDEVINSDDTVIYSDLFYTSYSSSFSKNALDQDLTASGYSLQKLSYPVFKPSTYVYNTIGIGDCYAISGKIANKTSFYGLNNNQADSHLIKNSELGAVVYLAHSKYGRNREAITANNKNINETTKTIYGVTGYSNEEPMGVDASSTNNMSGVFDLVGCAYIATSAYLTNEHENLEVYGKIITQYNEQTGEYNKTSTKYVTTYQVGNEDTSGENYNIYKNYEMIKKHGDALFETSANADVANVTRAWFEGYSNYPCEGKPFFLRTIGYNLDKSMFGYNRFIGAPEEKVGFSVVLIGKN